jgi:hypothetical protein
MSNDQLSFQPDLLEVCQSRSVSQQRARHADGIRVAEITEPALLFDNLADRFPPSDVDCRNVGMEGARDGR